MDDTSPDPSTGLITVDVTRTITQQADRAYLHVTVSGSSLVTGRAALRQAREVAELVEAARNAGLAEDDLELLQVHAGPAGSRAGGPAGLPGLRESAGSRAGGPAGLPGLKEAAGSRLGRTSATYRLRLRCRDLDRLPELLGAATAQRHTRLDQLSWGYPDAEQARDEAIGEAVALLRRRASVTAEAMGVQVLGVHVIRVHTPDPGEPIPMARTMMAAAATPESVDLGMEVSHTRTLSVTVSGELRVGPA